MRCQEDVKTEKTDLRKAFQEITAENNYLSYVWVARGARLKPSFKLSHM